MMRLFTQVPNFITLLNLFSGCIAVTLALSMDDKNYTLPLAFVALGIFFDFFDGFFARLWKIASPLGVQLDSLADMVTSGVVPGLVMFHLLSPDILVSHGLPSWLQYAAFIITLGSCWRLANFNIDTRQTDHFIGLPTPANALMITSLPILKFEGSLLFFELLITPWVLFAIIIFSCYMLNAEVDLFALKIKKKGLKNYLLQIVFGLASVIFLIVFGLKSIPAIILLYILMSVIFNRFRTDAAS